MELILRNNTGQPIYEQIRDQIKGQILSGELAAGAPLPSIRALAKDLRISVITTKRAYDELESQGFLVTVAGKGSFVAQRSTALIREEHYRQIEQHLQQAARLAVGCGLTTEDLCQMLQILAQED